MYVFPLITCSIIISLLAVLVPTRKNSAVFNAFFLLSFCTLGWHGSWIFIFLEQNQSHAEIIAKVGHISILYLPVAYNRLYAEMIGIKTRTKLYHAFYLSMLILLFSTNFVIDGVNRFSWGYYPKAGILHPLFIAFVSYVVLHSVVTSLVALRNKPDVAKSKAVKTGILACIIFSLGSFDFLLNYRILDFYPVGFISSIVFVILIAIGIVGYDLFQKETRIRTLNEQNEQEKIRVLEKEKYIQQISRQNQELRLRDEIISSFVSPAVRREVALGENPLAFKPQKLLRTVVFIDMRGFTKIAEQLVLEQIFSLVNAYFEIVNKAVYSTNGEVNKYLGDGVLILFEDPRNCLAAISRFLADLKELNRAQVLRQGPEIQLGIGVSHGEVLCGNFGSDTKLERSVIGDVVNIAARLEKLTVSYGCPVISDDAFIKQVQDFEFCRPIGIELLKGRSKPTIIHELFFQAPYAENTYKISTKPLLMLVLDSCSRGNYVDALKTLDQIKNSGQIRDITLEFLKKYIITQNELQNERRPA